jgi:hypothetical protein
MAPFFTNVDYCRYKARAVLCKQAAACGVALHLKSRRMQLVKLGKKDHHGHLAATLVANNRSKTSESILFFPVSECRFGPFKNFNHAGFD